MKKTLTFLIIFGAAFTFWYALNIASADSTTAKSPASQANDGWTTSNLMELQDGSSATASAKSVSVDQLTFGFTDSDIPVGSTINGVTVEIDNHKTGTGNNTLDINLLNVGALCVAKTHVQDAVDDDTYDSLGGTSDTWSCESLTQTNITNSAFGVRITSFKSGGPDPAADTWLVDHVRVTVEYTPPAGGPPPPPPSSVTVKGGVNFRGGVIIK